MLTYRNIAPGVPPHNGTVDGKASIWVWPERDDELPVADVYSCDDTHAGCKGEFDVTGAQEGVVQTRLEGGFQAALSFAAADLLYGDRPGWGDTVPDIGDDADDDAL